MSRSTIQGFVLILSIIVLGSVSLLGYNFYISFGEIGTLLAYHAIGTFIGGIVLIGVATYFALRIQTKEHTGVRPNRWRVMVWCRYSGTFIIAMIFVSVLINILTVQTSSSLVTFIILLQVFSAVLTWVAGFLSTRFPQIPPYPPS